jgi:hypothetical protein
MSIFIANGAVLLVGGLPATPGDIVVGAPEAFSDADWSIADAQSGGTANITILALPDNGGSSLTEIEYRVDGGSWDSLTSSPSIGTYTITGFTDDVEASVQIRANNAEETGNVFLAKSVTTTDADVTITFSAAYTDGSGGEGPTLDITDFDPGSETGPFTFRIATHANGTTLERADIANGTGAAEDVFSFADADGEVAGELLDLVTSLSDGHLSLYVEAESGGVSEVTKLNSVDVDATAPVLSSPTATATGANSATWGVTSNKVTGVVHAGARPSGDGQLTAEELIGGTGIQPLDFDADATMTADANNGGSFDELAPSTEYIVDMVAVDDWGNVSNIVSTSAFTTDAAASLFVTTLPLQTEASSTATPTYTVDMSGAVSGDRVIVWAGSGQVPTGVTFNSAAMSAVAGATTTDTFGRRIACWEYVLPSDGTASDTIVVTQSSANNQNALAVVHTNGVITDSDAFEERGQQLDTSVTPTSTTNKIIAVAMGENGTEGFTSWVGVTEQEEIQNPSWNYVAIAEAENVAASALTVSVTPVSAAVASDEDAALSVVVIEEAP